MFATFFGRGKLLARPIMAAILLAAVAAQIVLLALLLSLGDGLMPLPAAITIQILDPLLLLGISWIASRHWPPSNVGYSVTPLLAAPTHLREYH